MLRKLALCMTAIAALTLVPAALDYVKVESGRTCPGVQGTAGFCLASVFDGQTYAVTFDSDAFEAHDTATLLVGILTASAAILAIWFTLNQMVLSNMAQKYSSKLVESYTKKPSSVFMGFVLIVAGSASLLFGHSSLPAWFAAYAVLVLTAGFVAILWFFVREFMYMKLVVSPYNFINDAQEKILADMKVVKGAPVRALNEQSQSLTQSLGYTAVKAMAANDEDVCMACVNALGEVGKSTLDKKTDSSEDTAVNGTRYNLPDGANTKFVINEFERILKDSTIRENSTITRHVLKKIYEITSMAMGNKNNWDVIRVLYDTDSLKGSLYWKWVERLIDVGNKSDKIYMIRHLAYLPAVREGVYMPFVEKFVTYHVFRSVKAIIDKGDFELFKEVIRLFSYHLPFRNMESMRDRIQAQISDLYAGRENLTSQHDKIVFELHHDTKINFGRIRELKKEVGCMLAQDRPSASADSDQSNTEHVYEDMDRLYIYSLLWGTFFRIACYLIGKGDDHASYLHELWYHTNPDGQSYYSTNTTPCSKDVDWNSAYPIWLGQVGFGETDIMDDENTYAPHYYEYAVLHMLREGKIWRAPTDDEIAEWGESGKGYALEHHYEIVSQIDTDRFLKALDSLSSELLARMLPGLDVRDRVERVKRSMEQFKNKRQDTKLNLVIQMPMDKQKTKELKEMAHRVYSERALSDSVARIKYDSQLRGAVRVIVPCGIPRESLVKGNLSLSESFVSGSADAELAKILEIAGDGAMNVRADAGKLKNAIKSCIEQMRDSGHNPSVAFVSLSHRGQMPETYATSTIDAGGPPIRIIQSPWDRPPEDTWILDPECVEITYGAEDEAGRIQFDIKDAKAEMVTMTSSIHLSVRVLDGGGIARIVSGEA